MIFHRCKHIVSLSISFEGLYRSQNQFFWRPISSKSVPVAEYLVNRRGFSPETASTVSASVTHIRSPENSDSVLGIFEQCGFSKTQIEKTLKFFPKILSADPEKTIKPKIKNFQDLGFSMNDIADIVANYPWIFRRSADKQLFSIAWLKDFVGTNSSMSKVFKRSSWFLGINLKKTVIPNVEYMRCCGVCDTQINKLLYNFPRLFTFKPDTIKCLVRRVDEMGYDRKSKMFVHAIRVLSSLTEEKWVLKKQMFRGLGWSEDDILFVFRRNPNAFTVSDTKIREIVKYLANAGGYDSSFLVLHPEMFLYSIEGRIKPRFQIWQILRNKKLLNVSLPTVCKMKNEVFSKKYVLPYVDIVGKYCKADDGK